MKCTHQHPQTSQIEDRGIYLKHFAFPRENFVRQEKAFDGPRLSFKPRHPELKQKTCSHARANKDLEQRNESGNESKVETSWLTQCLRLRCTVLHPVLLQTPPFYQQVTSKNGHYIPPHTPRQHFTHRIYAELLA